MGTSVVPIHSHVTAHHQGDEAGGTGSGMAGQDTAVASGGPPHLSSGETTKQHQEAVGQLQQELTQWARRLCPSTAM